MPAVGRKGRLELLRVRLVVKQLHAEIRQLQAFYRGQLGSFEIDVDQFFGVDKTRGEFSAPIVRQSPRFIG